MKPARLPALPTPPTSAGQEIYRFLAAVKERLEVREGSRRDPLEEVVTKRDLVDAGVLTTRATAALPKSYAPGQLLVTGDGGTYAVISVNDFAERIRSSRLYRDLSTAVGSPESYASLPAEIRKLLETSIADEAKKRGADIRDLDFKLQTETKSLAYRLNEITASIGDAAAGVRQLTFAFAEADRAVAGQIATVQARLDNAGGTGVTVEQKLTATADRVAGLAGEYTVKVSAGRAVAGFGLAASEDPTGATESSFIVQADQFAVTAAYTFAQAATPSATATGQTWYKTTDGTSYRSTATGTGNWVLFTPVIPFGVDTTTGEVYINGNLRINSGGNTLTDSAQRGSLAVSYELSGLLTYPTRLGGKARWYGFHYIQESTPSAAASNETWFKPSTATAYTSTAAGTANWVLATAPSELNAAVGDNAATAAVCAVLGRSPAGTTHLQIGDTVTLKSANGATSWTAATSQFGSSAINASAYGFGTFVLVGDAGKLTTSPDGVTWTARTSGFGADNIKCCAFAYGVFVIGGGSGKRSWSTDGVTWTASSAFGAGSTVMCVAYGGDKWVSIGLNKNVETSTDGKTWTAAATAPFSQPIYALTWGDGLFIAAGVLGVIYTSPDGITWTSHPNTSATTETWYAATYADGKFLVAGGSGNIIVTDSPNGVNLLTSPAALTSQSVSTAGVSYVLTFSGAGSVTLSGTASGVKTAGVNTFSCTSGTLTLTVSGEVTAADLRPSVITWPAVTSITGGSALAFLSYGDGSFVTGGSSGKVFTSQDGGTWTERTSALANYVTCAAFGGQRFVLGATGAQCAYSAIVSQAAVTGYWSGSQWVNPGVIIDGNLLVTGSLSAGTGEFNKVVIKFSGFIATSVTTNSSGYVDVEVPVSGIGTPLFAWAAYIPNVDLMPSLVWIGNTDAVCTFRLHVWDKAGKVPYAGSVPVLKIGVF